MEAHWDGSKAQRPRCCSPGPTRSGTSNCYDRDPEGRKPRSSRTTRMGCSVSKDFAPEDRPPVAPVFFAFRIAGGHRPRDDRDRPRRCVKLVARPVVRHPLVPCGRSATRGRWDSSPIPGRMDGPDRSPARLVHGVLRTAQATSWCSPRPSPSRSRCSSAMYCVVSAPACCIPPAAAGASPNATTPSAARPAAVGGAGGDARCTTSPERA